MAAMALVLAMSAHAQPKEFTELKREVLAAQNKRAVTLQMVRLATTFQPAEMDKFFLFADSIRNSGDPDDSIFNDHASRFVHALATYKKGDIENCAREMGALIPYFRENDQELYERAMNFQGLFLIRLHLQDSAIVLYETLLESLDSANYKARLGAHVNLGRAFKQVGNYDAAIDHFIAAMEADPTDEATKMNTYMNIADIFGEMEFYDKGIETLRMVNQTNLPPMQLTMAFYNNFGTLFFLTGQYDSSVYYLKKAITLGNEKGFHHLNVKNRITLSEIYMSQQLLEEARAILKEAEKAARAYPTPQMLADLNMHQASCQMQLNNADSAIYYLEKIENPEGVRPMENVKSVFQLFSEAYEMKGNMPLSNLYLNKHVAWYDSVRNVAEIKFLQDAKAKYLLAQNEKSLKNSEKNAAFLGKSQGVLAAILLAVIALAVTLFLLLRKNKKQLQSTQVQNQSLSKEIQLNRNEILELKSKALLQIDDIVSIESDGHYLEFYMKSKGKPEVDRNRIKEILEILPPKKFVQIHKSYIVNIDHIKAKYASKVLLIDGRELPVSRTYKEALNKITGS